MCQYEDLELGNRERTLGGNSMRWGYSESTGSLP